LTELKGSRLGRYLVDEKIAVGGMAEIYRAHTSLGEPVAIKVIHPQFSADPKFVQMFLDEAKIVVGLKHTNIVQVFDFGRVSDTYYFSMEWIDGKALSSVVKRQMELNIPFPLDVAIVILIDVLKGLGHAHTRRDRFDRELGIVHRDVSPPNILLARSGLSKIADFGIADAEHKVIQTHPGIIRGKFSYMSPEQSRGEVVDQRSDVFSSGIVLYELLTGFRLFLRDQDLETIQAVRVCQVPPLSMYRDDVPESLEKVIRKALAPSRNRRYSTAIEFAGDLYHELKRINPKASRKLIAEFMKVLFPWETFVGAEEPLPVLLARWKQRGRARSRPPVHRSGATNVSTFLYRHRYAASMAIGALALLVAEWVARSY
jgi:eukaryotic-like serine/threonine-protein kinase